MCLASTVLSLEKVCLVAQSCLTLCDPMDCSPPGSSVHGGSPGKNTGLRCYALLQGIFPTQGSTPVSHIAGKLFTSEPLGKPKNTGGGGPPFSRGSSQPRNRTRVSCIAGGFFTSSATREALRKNTGPKIWVCSGPWFIREDRWLQHNSEFSDTELPVILGAMELGLS